MNRWEDIDREKRKFSLAFTRKIKRALVEQVDIIGQLLLQDNIEDVINRAENLINKDEIEKIFILLYQTVGIAFAKDKLREFKSQLGQYITKDEEQLLEDIWLQEMKKYATTEAGRRIVSITGSSKKEALKILRRIINEVSIEEGIGIEAVRQKFQKYFYKQWNKGALYRARRIATTEVLSAANKGGYEGALATGVPMEKIWTVSKRPVKYERHTAYGIDGMRRKMGERFPIGRCELMYPGDPLGTAEEVINCHCGLMYEVI